VVSSCDYFERFLSLENGFNYTAYSVVEDESSGTLVCSAENVGKGKWNCKAELKWYTVDLMIRKKFLSAS
jgi:hypothetical protein